MATLTMRTRLTVVAAALLMLMLLPRPSEAFSVAPRPAASTGLSSSFMSDGDDYSSDDERGLADDLAAQYEDMEMYDNLSDQERDELHLKAGGSVELKPVPMSKNTGNRLLAFVWDKDVDIHGRDMHKLHYDRDQLTEDHIIFIRKRNLYNETVNTDSMVDILKSYHLLSSELARCVGHVLVLETTEMKYAYEMLQEEPIIKSLSDGDLSNVKVFRWRHIRDHTLRQDDGRFGTPCMLVAIDHDPEVIGNSIRTEYEKDNLEYMIRSSRVISAGPIHLPTELKNDPSSIAVGDVVMFNAIDREAAIEFVEEMPYAKAGLYKEMRVLFYNSLDVTGKFVLENSSEPNLGAELKEAMEQWGYPVDDMQTPWLNW